MMEVLKETALKITAIFFVWFTTIFGIGIAILMLIKISLLLFPEIKDLIK